MVKRRTLAAAECPVARALDAIGDWWSLLIVRDAFDGVRRFGEFQKNLGIAKGILTTRLRSLVDLGVLEVVPASDGSAFREYALTDKGRGLFHVIVGLRQWGETHLYVPGEARSTLVDRSGRPVARLVLPSHEGGTLSFADTTVRKATQADPSPSRRSPTGSPAGARMTFFPQNGVALVIGASGGIGSAVADALEARGRFGEVIRLGRAGDVSIDVTSEPTIIAAAAAIAARGGDLRLVFDATGFLHDSAFRPEKSWSQIDPAHMQKSFTINAIGPALLMKHFLPLLAADGKTVFATLSARVGSIGDNELGGWYAYRASKAALNQLVKTASVELKRRRPQAICVALHPGTVATALTGPFAKTGLDVQTPEAAARALLDTIDRIEPVVSGAFLDRFGRAVTW